MIIASDIDLMKLGNLTVVLYTTTIYMLVFGLHLGWGRYKNLQNVQAVRAKGSLSPALSLQQSSKRCFSGISRVHLLQSIPSSSIQTSWIRNDGQNSPALIISVYVAVVHKFMQSSWTCWYYPPPVSCTSKQQTFTTWSVQCFWVLEIYLLPFASSAPQLLHFGIDEWQLQ